MPHWRAATADPLCTFRNEANRVTSSSIDRHHAIELGAGCLPFITFLAQDDWTYHPPVICCHCIWDGKILRILVSLYM